MTKISDINSYVDELSQNLSILEDNEVQEVTEFYSEYLMDSDLKNRAEIEQELGSPKRLARKVLADYSISTSFLDEQEDFSSTKEKNKSRTERFEKIKDESFHLSNATIVIGTLCILMMMFATLVRGFGGFLISLILTSAIALIGLAIMLVKNNLKHENVSREVNEPKKISDAKSVWIIILGLLAIPVGIPVAIFLVGLILAALGAILGLIIAFLGLVVGLFGGGIFIIFMSLRVMAENPNVTAFYSGLGITAIVFAMMLAPAFYQLVKILFEAIVRFVKYIGHRFFKKQYYKKNSEEV